MSNNGNNTEHDPFSFINQAKTINTDLGRHVRKCGFSNNLSGRFYTNGSMRSHQARARKINQMQTKRKLLERSIKLEEKKIEFLEDELRKRIDERRNDEAMNLLLNESAITIQHFVRIYRAKERANILRVENEIKEYLAVFLQARFRGNRDRIIFENKKKWRLLHELKTLSAIRIQCKQREIIARECLKKKRKEKQLKRTRLAVVIQSFARGYLARQCALSKRRFNASICIQCCFRCFVARRKLKVLIKRKAKPMRVPLHERRYSTYSVSNDDASAGNKLQTIIRRRKSSLMSLQAFHTLAEKDKTPQPTQKVHHTSSQQPKIPKQDSEKHLKSRNEKDTTRGGDSKSTTVKSDRQESNQQTEIQNNEKLEKETQIKQARHRAALRAQRNKQKSQDEESKKQDLRMARKIELSRLEDKRKAAIAQSNRSISSKKTNDQLKVLKDKKPSINKMDRHPKSVLKSCDTKGNSTIGSFHATVPVFVAEILSVDWEQYTFDDYIEENENDLLI